MNISELFIKRPVTTTLIMLGILVFGTMAYRALPVSDLPAVDFPTIQVQAGLPGASPETMAATVALPLEKQFAGIAGLTNINSVSQQGSTNITLQFDLSRNIDAAAQDVQAMIGRTARSLPPQMPAPPSYQKSNPGDQSVILLVLRSATLPLSMVDEYAQQTIAQRLSMVDGVAQVDVFGSQKFAVRIDLDPRELAARSIGIDQVAAAVANANSNVPTGTMYGDKTFVVQTNGQLMRATAYGPTIVAYRNGNPVRLDEVAHVYDGVENDKSAAWQLDERCVLISIRKQPGTNVVEVVDRVKALLPAMTEQLPAAMSLGSRNDRSETIRASVHDVKITLLATVGLVVLVIFLFLRNFSATLIPSLALPASLVGTFTAMYLLGYSMDNLSLMALTLSVGFVVDDAIVMLENIVRHMEMGKTRMQAAFEGSKEIAFTILAMTVSLAAVFIPVLFMGGIVGRLLHEFAVTISVAILISGFVSISLTPMLCSRFLRAAACREARPGLQRVRAHVRRMAASVRLDAADHAASSRDHHGGVDAAAGRDGLPVHGRPEGFPAQRRPGTLHGEHRGRAGHQLRGHDTAPEEGGDDPPERSERLHGHRDDGRHRQQWRLHQHRPHLGRAEVRAPSGRCRSTRSSRHCARRWRSCRAFARS